MKLSIPKPYENCLEKNRLDFWSTLCYKRDTANKKSLAAKKFPGIGYE